MGEGLRPKKKVQYFHNKQIGCLFNRYSTLILYKPNHVHTRTCCVVDKVLNDIRHDLKESGLYFKYMQEKGPDE